MGGTWALWALLKYALANKECINVDVKNDALHIAVKYLDVNFELD